MTLEAATANLGRGVVYSPYGAYREDGIIVAVNRGYVMVSYAGSVKATRAEDLTFLMPDVVSAKPRKLS